jgi:hypothetical protein
VIPNFVVSCKLVLQAHICASITFFSSKSPFSENINQILLINTFIIVENPLFSSSCIEHGLSGSESFTADQKQSFTGTQALSSFVKINGIYIGQKSQNSIFSVLAPKGFEHEFDAQIRTSDSNHYQVL